jgi:hypothetical protein
MVNICGEYYDIFSKRFEQTAENLPGIGAFQNNFKNAVLSLELDSKTATFGAMYDIDGKSFTLRFGRLECKATYEVFQRSLKLSWSPADPDPSLEYPMMLGFWIQVANIPEFSRSG